MLQYLKRQAMKLRSGLTKGIVLLLCLATLFSSAQLGGLALIAEAAEGEHSVLYAGKATTSVTLPQDDKLTLTVEEKKDATYAWQLCADKDADQWVTISGQKQDFLTLSYAMVASLLDSRGVTYVRSVITGSAGASVSQPVAVRVSYVVPDAAASSAPSVSAPRKAAVRYNAPIGADLTTYTITVKFVYADGTLVADPYVATIEAGGAFTTTVKFPESVGYLPYWESDEQSTTERMLTFPAIDQDYTYTVTYKPTIVKYQVHHLIQNILDDNYTLYTTTEKQGLNGSLIADCAIDIDGFSALYYDKDVKIAADGSTEVEVYYDRNYYLVSFDLNGGYGVDPIYTRYGATVSVGKPTRPGYVFDGWKLVSCGGETPTADQEAAYSLVNSITVPFMNLKYQAQWKTSDTTYTVVYWIQNANDDNYSYYDSKKVNATSAEIVNGSTFGQAETIRHFTFNADKTDKNVIVEGDGSTVVNVYYTRNTYTLTFKDGQKTLTCTKTEHKHSDSCCKFGGTGISHWYHRDSCCKLGLSEHTHSNSCYKTSDLTITAKYQADIHGNFPIKDGNDTIWWKVPNGTETYGDSDEQRYLGSIDTMPGEDISFNKNDSESGAKIYYYVETLNGAAGDTTYNGKNYKQYKVIDLDYSSYTNLTYAEEFHPITGFTQGDSNPYLPEGGSVRMNRNNYLYYTRNSYNLKFYNYNASEENVLEFLYTKDSENAYYMIVHWVQNLEGDGYTEYRTIQSPGKIGNIITEEPLSIAGFTYNEGRSTASGTITAEGLVLNLYYDRNMYSYTVKYLEAGTDKELSDSKVSSASYRYGTVVSEEAINIPGYKLVSEPHKTLTINNRTDGNVIKFYYQEQNVTINYIPVPLDAGTVSTGTETIKAFTGVSLGSVPTPKDGYRFVGWYTDTQCTTPVPSDWVDSNNKLTPQKQDGTYHAASYFAKFEKATASLTIQKTGWDEVDENQAFLFHVKGIDEKNKDIDMIVTVYGNGKSTIADLPIGKYDVSEQTNWSWRYTPKSGLQTITLVPSGGTLTFENSRTQTQWLDGDNYRVNHFDSKNQ